MTTDRNIPLSLIRHSQASSLRGRFGIDLGMWIFEAEVLVPAM
jgi:hypothetical protein